MGSTPFSLSNPGYLSITLFLTHLFFQGTLGRMAVLGAYRDSYPLWWCLTELLTSAYFRLCH